MEQSLYNEMTYLGHNLPFLKVLYNDCTVKKIKKLNTISSALDQWK
jgi:hypothetical protein